MTESQGDVHTAHCCKWHGCKYNNGFPGEREKCTVLNGAPQEYPCEVCSWAWEEYLEVKQFDPEWIKYITKWKNDGGYI